jgi:basic membrane lipoprotein Med (substrate-binding protein (PBP1-ABC) superfamily)
MKNVRKLVLASFVLALIFSVAPAVLAQDGIETVCLVTDTGQIDDGTFNQYAHEGATAVVEDYDLEYTFIETQATTDYEANINTCVDEGFDVIITVGFLIGDATWEAAVANPDVFFIGVDQFVGDRTDDDGNVTEEAPANFVGIQFREDQAGFMAGALAALMTESDVIAGVYGVEIPPVKKFRNGFEQGALYINPDITLLGVYIDDFVAPDRGASAAEQFIGEGADVIFGAGGQTGSGGIVAAAQQGVYVIGVDQDEYLTTFGNGETPGAEYLISSATKGVKEGVYDMVAALAEGDTDGFPGGGVYIMDAELNGIGLAEPHDADVPEEILAQVDEIFVMLAEGDIDTGVDPVTGDLLEAE